MDDYEIYASVIVIMSMVSIALDMYQTRKQEKGLMNMVHTSGIVEVVRNGGRMEQVGSDEVRLIYSEMVWKIINNELHIFKIKLLEIL